MDAVGYRWEEDRSGDILDEPPLVRFRDFGDWSLDLRLLVWISNRKKTLQKRGGETMGGFRKKMEIQKDKVEGTVKEQAGKATGNKKMELKGKAQKLTASVKAKIPTIKK